MRSSRVQTKLVLVGKNEYNPYFCKTCQKIGRDYPKISRTLYSDCEEHYQKRVKRLLSTGVTIFGKKDKIRLF
ncbi:MAG: hypothetical protein ACYCQJ_00530 [Nitrososphaerales archaeon]